MPYYSQSNFAKLYGISPQAISKAVGESRIVKSAKGIDPSHPTNLYFVDKLKDNSRLKGMKAQQEEKDELDKLIEGEQQEEEKILKRVEQNRIVIDPTLKKKAGRPKKRTGPTPGIRLEEVDIENFSVDEIKADITALTKQSVDKLKVVEQIKALQLKTEERKSKLVPRDLVRRVLGKLYQIDVNELRTLPDKLSSDIAAECKIDDTDVIFAINKLIEKEIYKTLEHMKRLLNDFLVGIKAERIE